MSKSTAKITTKHLTLASFLLHQDQVETLRRVAFEEGLSASALVRKAIDAELGIKRNISSNGIKPGRPRRY